MNIGYNPIPSECGPAGSCPICNDPNWDEEDDVSIQYYKVGGFLRDHVLGIASKDIDFSVVAPSYVVMVADIIDMGCEIFQERPEFYTVRAKHPILGAVDFVWARKEGPYSDGRHPNFVSPGTIEDDLARRDFTMNALAVLEQDDMSEIIDPHGGLLDIQNKIIRCVGDPEQRFREDGLRVFRAIRFMITKKMNLDRSVHDAILSTAGLLSASRQSVDRVREELMLMMRANWLDTISILGVFGPFGVLGTMMNDVYPDLWFKPTTEKR